MQYIYRTVPVLLILSLAVWAWGSSNNPPDGFTSAPGEGTCAMAGCHDTYPPYAGGSVRIEVPNRYASGETLNLRVKLWTAPWQKRRGFSVTVLDNQNRPAGRLLVTDSLGTQLSTAPSGREYLKNTQAGTAQPDSPDETFWSFAWEAPAGPVGTVTFYVAAVGADGDSTAAGDLTSTYGEFVLDNTTDCFLTTGDVDGSGVINASDIVYLVNYVLRGGSPPKPCTMVGDVNCNGTVTTSDLIDMIRIVFKGAYPWCNVCNLWADGTWRCPALDGK